LLFTHRGISGPAMLQISSYWLPGDSLEIDVLPDLDVVAWLETETLQHPQAQLSTALATQLPKRLVQVLGDALPMQEKLQTLSRKDKDRISGFLHAWLLKPNGTEGYRTAEVTLGGVDTRDLSSQTMMAKQVPGLYFIGEVVDVTGHLGGFNFQWAWSSGYCAGMNL
ncbi:MAG: NAD(P)/FAD-dependent oxidoreductase, partial [Ghiorsea sp.]